MAISPQAMRESFDMFRAAKHELGDGDSCDVDARPIRRWGERTYVIVGNLDLRPGMQRLEVIDITDRPEVGRFPMQWPFDWRWYYEREEDAPMHALVITPGEGHVSILYESGYVAWVMLADLPVRVEPGTHTDAAELRRQQMDELEASVDAGGSLFGG